MKISNNDEFRYMMLGRLQQDCDYFLGNGNRLTKNLWARNVKEHISEMENIFNELNIKPEWLSYYDIEQYEKNMA